MKELPMSLLLRPFNFETLATFVYQFAKDELPKAALQHWQSSRRGHTRRFDECGT